MQLEQTFIETLNNDELCNYSRISLEELIIQLQFYWQRLPFRLEEYELNEELSEEYLLLKQQYMHLSIRTWIHAKNLYDKCEINIVHGLTFYSANCEKCVSQGEQIDILKEKLNEKNLDMIMFPIDMNSDEILIKNLVKYYKISSTPAVMINDNVFQGRLYSAEELLPTITDEK